MALPASLRQMLEFGVGGNALINDLSWDLIERIVKKTLPLVALVL